MNYKCKRWKKKIAVIMKRDGYICQHFKRYGKIIEAQHVHHIYPVETYPEYAFCNWNLIALSVKAHNMMHARDTHELTELGKEYQRRVRTEKERFDATRSPQASNEEQNAVGTGGGNSFQL